VPRSGVATRSAKIAAVAGGGGGGGEGVEEAAALRGFSDCGMDCCVGFSWIFVDTDEEEEEDAGVSDETL
jgi:hypothetical protein